MANRGPALMGMGRASGENRAQEAAHEAISSPLLDDISIEGAKAVLINITGGGDLTIDEVTAVSSVIGEAAGDDGEIIFGTVHDPAMENELRVTVIATGFEPGETADAPRALQSALGAHRAKLESGAAHGRDVKRREKETVPVEFNDPRDLEIPTFIRRQMD